MDVLIPLMVILPIASALFLNLLHKKDRTIKILAIVTALVLPIVPLITPFGSHYFGGYAPLAQNSTIAQGLPSLITNTTVIYIPSGHYLRIYQRPEANDIHTGVGGILRHIYFFKRDQKTIGSLCYS